MDVSRDTFLPYRLHSSQGGSDVAVDRALRATTRLPKPFSISTTAGSGRTTTAPSVRAPSTRSVRTCTLADSFMSRPDGQLCWHNASLVAHLIEKTRSFLRMPANENATIISISQNDNGLMCRDPAEMAIIDAEKSPMGPLLRAINAVADAIVDEFPHVAVDTLACKCSLRCVFFRSLKEVASRALLSVPCAPDLSCVANTKRANVR